ncbi:hypothetical protein M0Q50_07890 [bacterium]|jgi:hypothetical protein|nr:hypothetical protein [bacterium]
MTQKELIEYFKKRFIESSNIPKDYFDDSIKIKNDLRKKKLDSLYIKNENI